MTLPTGKKLAELFFNRNKKEGNIWTCGSCRKGVRQGPAGYTNLCNHINHHHDTEIAKRMRDAINGKRKCFDALTYPRKTITAHAWLECIIMCLLPFSFCENHTIRRHFRHEGISRRTIMNYLQKLTAKVEEKIKALLPSRFAIVFDGWSVGDTHFVAIYATFPKANDSGFEEVLLGLSPMENEESQDANEHYDFVKFVLSVFGKTMDNVVALIGDNTSTNKAFARCLGPFFVGCHSHRYNLAMKDILEEYEEVIEKVQAIMKKLSYQIPAAKLRRFTLLKAKQRNVTRWSSTYDMLRRYRELKEFLPKLDDVELESILLSEEEDILVDHLCTKLRDLDSVTKELQRSNISLAEARVLFDGVIEKYPNSKRRLGPDSNIIENKRFESAIVKIQQNREEELTLAEKRAVAHLKKEEGQSSSEVPQESLSFAQRLLKKRRVDNQKSSDGYVDMRFILPTSNLCERLFSIAGYAMSDRRKNMLPANFESQLFLHINARLWGIQEVHEILQ